MGKYLIAVATSDGVHVRHTFGEAERFEVYEITRMHIANWKRER